MIQGALKSPPHRCTKSGNNFTGMSRHYPREIGVLSFSLIVIQIVFAGIRARAGAFQPYQLSGVGGSNGRVGRLIKSQTIENSFICYCLYKLLYNEE